MFSTETDDMDKHVDVGNILETRLRSRELIAEKKMLKEAAEEQSTNLVLGSASMWTKEYLQWLCVHFNSRGQAFFDLENMLLQKMSEFNLDWTHEHEKSIPQQLRVTLTVQKKF